MGLKSLYNVIVVAVKAEKIVCRVGWWGGSGFVADERKRDEIRNGNSA